jgi:hypothetical protein
VLGMTSMTLYLLTVAYAISAGMLV